MLIRNQCQENIAEMSVKGRELNSLMNSDLVEIDSRLHHEEEKILRLHKQVADACAKELELLNENHVLERKLSDLRLALDEKQNNALADSLKDLMTRKAYIEENLKLADELKVVEDENYVFTSSLLSLLSEFGIRPSVIDALSISSSTKRLYDQMHWKTRVSHVSNSYDMQFESPSIQPVNMNFQFAHNGVETRDAGGHAAKDHPTTSNDSEGEMKPGIEGFLIIGDAKPGNALQACGVPINGTCLCIFQWVRHRQDGTTEYVHGASNPEYFVTADDVDNIISVECIPLDNNGKKGELVKHYANNQNKIVCDPEMQQEIQRYASTGQATFNVLLLRDSSDSSESWEPASLILKRSGYQIKVSPVGIILREEKYCPDLVVQIPLGPSTQFLLTCVDGTSYPFSTSGTSNLLITDNDMWLRDVIVLTMRLFQIKALDDKRKGKCKDSSFCFI